MNEPIAALCASFLVNDDVLYRIETEFAINDILERVQVHEKLLYIDYQKLAYLNIPLVKIISGYLKVEREIAYELIKNEYVTYDNLINLLNYWLKNSNTQK